MRQALRGIVPESVVDRRKLGFPTPTRLWLRGTLGEWAGEVMYRSAAGGLLDLGYAQDLLAEHRRGTVDHSRKLWAVLTFCLWHAIFVEQSLPVQPAAPAPAERAVAVPQPRHGGSRVGFMAA
jgi:asparagine synthase (glutamine-hydrolysing)